MTTNKYKAFDPADYLEGMDDVAGYLEVALAESAEDPSALPAPSASSPARRT